jgi:hypothetical protein
MDFNHALIINRKSGWQSNEANSKNFNRIATTLANNNYAHTHAGLGGWHHRHNDWITYYEASPIMSYCGAKHGVRIEQGFPLEDDAVIHVCWYVIQ